MQDDEVDRLYGLPPDEFTAARDALAKRLRGEGRRDEAAAVKALKKPNLPAWAINQLARRHRKELGELIDAGEALRAAHEQLSSGAGRGKLRPAAERERQLVADLVERAEPLLSEAGTPSAANLERIRSTLHAAATDPELSADVELGRVVRDRQSVGLGPLAGAPAAPAKKDAEREAAQRREAREARARAEQAAKRLRAAEAALERARVDAQQAERELRKRQRAVEVARSEAEQAGEALRQTERTVPD